MRHRSRKKMAVGRDHSLSSEKRLEKMYPDKYPKMFTLTPGRKVAREDEDDEFNQWLHDTPPSLRNPS